jgi:hypothetical protein
VLYHRLCELDNSRFAELGVKAAVAAFLHEIECTLWERLPSCSQASGEQILGLLYVLDFSDFSMSHIDSNVMAYLTETMFALETHYPMLLHHCVTINAPATVTIVWGLIRGLLSKTTRERVEFCSPESSTARLLELVASISLPPPFGGTDSTWPAAGLNPYAEPPQSELGPWTDTVG